MSSKIILFGGSFDPIHKGHISVARFCLDYINADELFFIPANRSPFKNYNPALGSDRLEMIKLAIQNEPKFSVCDCELQRGQPSYTIDTIKYFRSKYAKDTEFFWIVGVDMAKEIYKWHKFDELINLCTICFMKRPKSEDINFENLSKHIPTVNLETIKSNIIPTPLIDINSTEIRQMISQGHQPQGLVEPEILNYIGKKGLYKA